MDEVRPFTAAEWCPCLRVRDCPPLDPTTDPLMVGSDSCESFTLCRDRGSHILSLDIFFVLLPSMRIHFPSSMKERRESCRGQEEVKRTSLTLLQRRRPAVLANINGLRLITGRAPAPSSSSLQLLLLLVLLLHSPPSLSFLPTIN